MPTAATERAILVVPLAQRRVVRAAATVIDPNGDNILDAALSATGNPPATHAWCSWQMTPRERYRLTTDLAPLVPLGVAVFWLDHYDPAAGHPDPADVLRRLGLHVIAQVP